MCKIKKIRFLFLYKLIKYTLYLTTYSKIIMYYLFLNAIFKIYEKYEFYFLIIIYVITHVSKKKKS